MTMQPRIQIDAVTHYHTKNIDVLVTYHDLQDHDSVVTRTITFEPLSDAVDLQMWAQMFAATLCDVL